MSSKSFLPHHPHHQTSPSPSPSSSSSPPILTPPSRNIFLLKSLSIILMLTILVLLINYYLISNCPKPDNSPNQLYILDNNNNNNDSPKTHHNSLDKSSSSSSSNNLSPSSSSIKLTISIYYEILCPDSKHFILKQLVPAYNKYRNALILRFVPFGKADVIRKNPGFEFSCQHGPEECHGNKLHSCIISKNPKNESLQLDIIRCCMERYRLWGATIKSIDEVTLDCLRKHDNDYNNQLMMMCPDADDLLAIHGYETLGLKPPASFIPTIAIDGSLSNQRQILRDLDTVICQRLKSKAAAAAAAATTTTNNHQIITC